MQDFIDVNPGEKTVMGLWNQFIMKYRFVSIEHRNPL